jgi:hypothetical protein
MRSVIQLSAKLSVLALALSSQALMAGQNAGPGVGDPFDFHFDEIGNGSFLDRDTLASGLSPGFLAVDPGTGMTTLTYQLPSAVGGGFVGVFTEENIGVLSDILHFYDDGNGGSLMSFYSADVGTGLPADVGLPDVGIDALVQENADDTFGFFAGGTQGVNNDYYGLSADDLGASNTDVPEASTWAAVAGVTGMVGLSLWRRRAKA